MAEPKEEYILTNPSEEPSDELLRIILGEKSGWLQQVYQDAMATGSGVTIVWKYYHDVRQWLCRLMNKKETICWIGILENTFRVTFYFSSRFESLIESSDLPAEVKEAWRQTGEKKFRPISVLMEKPGDIELVKQLIRLKKAK
jgi:hypothetical protein